MNSAGPWRFNNTFISCIVKADGKRRQRRFLAVYANFAFVHSFTSGSQNIGFRLRRRRRSFCLSCSGYGRFAADLDCREVVRNCRRLHVEDIRIKECSFTDLPYENGVFDAVVSLSVLHHAAVSDIKKGFREIYRVLKPEGTFLFDFLSVFDESYGKGKKVEYNTFVGSRSGEENIPHHYADEKEIVRFTNQFHRVKIQKSVTVCFDLPEPYVSREFQVTAIK